MRGVVVLVLVAAVTAVSASPIRQLGEATVPIVAQLPAPVIEVRIGGRGPYRFLVDTGAQGQARADSALVRALGLTPTGRVSAGDTSGSRIELDTVLLPSVEVGGVTFKNIVAAVRDYNAGQTGARIDGVLGLDLFVDHLLTMDYRSSTLSLRTGALPEPDGLRTFEMTLPRGVPALRIQVAGQVFEADLDTGAAGAVMLPASAASSLPLVSKPVLSGIARTATGTFEVLTATLDGTLQVGEWTIAQPALEFSDRFTHANVGSRLLREFVVTVDQRNRRIRLSRSRTGPIDLPAPRRAGVAGPTTPEGLLVDVVVPGGAAERAGVRKGDLIVEIAGRQLVTIPATEVGAALTTADVVSIVVRRDGQKLALTLRYRPE